MIQTSALHEPKRTPGFAGWPWVFRQRPTVAMDWTDDQWVLGWYATSSAQDPAAIASSSLSIHTHPLPSGVLAGARIVDETALARVIAEAVDSIRLGRVDAVMALSAPDLIHRWLPAAERMSMGEPPSRAECQALLAPGREDRARNRWDKQAVDARLEHDAARWWLVGVQQSTVAAWQRVFKASGIRLARIDVRPAALLHQWKDEIDGVVCWLDGHAGYTQWGVAVDGVIEQLGECAHSQLSEAEHAATVIRQLTDLHARHGFSSLWVVGSLPAFVVEQVALGLGVSVQTRQHPSGVCSALLRGLL